MRLFVLLLPSIALAQVDDFRAEITTSAWRTSIAGTVQSGGVPISLHEDLNLATQWTFFGKLVFQPARRHRIIVEGAPYHFSGFNTPSRTITYNGRMYSFNDRVSSDASLTYIFGGYQFDVISRTRGHLGLEAGAAYLNGTGTIRSLTTGASATPNELIGIPLAGADFRLFFGPARMNVNGEAEGMALGGYGHYFQAVGTLGAGVRRLMFQAGYQYVNADIHENRAFNPTGISPVIMGPIFSLQVRFF